MMKGTPPYTRPDVSCDSFPAWMAGLGTALRKARKDALIRRLNGVDLVFIRTPTSVWMLGPNHGNCRIAWRLFSQEQGLATPTFVASPTGGILVEAKGGMGVYQAAVDAESASGGDASLMIHVTITLDPTQNLKTDSPARDLVVLDGRLEPLPAGQVYTGQTGPTAGQVFMSGGDFVALYFHNLTALAAYAHQTGADLSGSVGADWPEVGLKLPGGPMPLAAGKKVVVSDAWLRITPERPQTDVARALVFMAGLAEIYRQLPLPAAGWFDWPAMARRTVRALAASKDCTEKIKGVPYFNAYVGNTGKPPESMVQGAVLVPLLEYEAWSGNSKGLSGRFTRTLHTFYDKKLATLVRWLPGVAFCPENNSDEEAHYRMDSWYLLHSLMNVARLAELGWREERGIFLDSLEYAIRAAQHFKYDWPVFYDQRDFSVPKMETAPGEGGEQDVPGLYAHVMIQAWRMTQEPRYLEEAEKSAMKLKHLAFGVLYQTNNTMFGAIALAWLWKITGNIIYRDLGLVSMGSILSHLWVWEPPGSRTRTWRTFMGLPPLHDAPYIAAYEEAELLAAGQVYLETMGPEAPHGVSLLLAEYFKNLLHRGRYYFPSELPAASIATDPKEGKISRGLAIPVEDLYPSDSAAGQVGQEVYGAALALVLTTRAFHRRKGVHYTFWSNAPVHGIEFSLPPPGGRGTFHCTLGGTAELKYEIRMIPHAGYRLDVVMFPDDKGHPSGTSRTPEGHDQCFLQGGSKMVVSWQTTAVQAKSRRSRARKTAAPPGISLS